MKKRISVDSDKDGNESPGSTETRKITVHRIDGIEIRRPDPHTYVKIYRGQAVFSAHFQHHRYPECRGSIELRAETWTIIATEYPSSGVLKIDEILVPESAASTKRTITDDGRTPLSALRETAKAVALLKLAVKQEHKGGAPKGMRASTKGKYLKLAESYKKTILSHRQFAAEKGIPRSRLERAIAYSKVNEPSENSM